MKKKKEVSGINDLRQVEIIWNRNQWHTKFRREVEVQAFNGRHKCRKCGRHKDIQIHHLYQYGPKAEIEEYEDFKLIPWIPLCKKCHMVEHSIQPPESAEDD